MQDEPHPPEILAAVARFLRDIVAPGATGASAYQARVAAAALDLVRREIEQAHTASAELNRLRSLLADPAGTLPDLTAELARRLGNGDWDFTTPGVADHLWATTREKLAVDQPHYSGLRMAPAVITENRS
jgi:hypothetical protein